MKSIHILCITLCLAVFNLSNANAQTTSWKGVTSTAWNVATNWTNGVPTSAVQAILGDGNFTGVNQPMVNVTASCKSLTIGGSVTTILTLTKNLTVAGSVLINSNATISHPASTLSLTGNWTNNGTYNATSTSSSVIFSGTAQSYEGANVTSFRKLTVNSGSILTLNANLVSAGASSLISISGTLNPNEIPSYTINSEAITVNSAGVLKVNAADFATNYTVSGAVTLSSGSIVEYSATAIDQTVSSAFSYSTLRISGVGRTKSVSADLPLLRSTSSSVGNIYVLSGTFDLQGFLANRGTTVVGGTISVSNAAFLKIGGANTFPAGFGTTTLSLNSTVEYNGLNQTVAAKTYGNLLLSSGSGSIVKTMPATAFTVAGNFVIAQGAGSAVSCTAASNISVTGALTIGVNTTFNAATFSHAVTGNWINNGTFVPATSTVTLKGASTTIGGNAVQSFNNLTITGSNITAPAITDLTLSGNLATSGSGALTMNSPSLVTMSGTTKTLTGINLSFDNLSITGVVTTSSTYTLRGDLTVSNSFIASGGILTMSGTGKNISNSGTLTLRGVVITGSINTGSNFNVTATFGCTGSFTATAGTVSFSSTTAISGIVKLFNVTLVSGTLSLAANAELGIAGAFTITSGTFNVTSNVPNTVNYNGSAAQSVRNTSYNNLVLSNGSAKTALGAITVNNTFTLNAGTTFNAGSFTLTVVKNWVNNGTFNAGTSTVLFSGSVDGSVTGTTTFNILLVNKGLATYNVNLFSDITAATATITQGTLNTKNNVITITSNRTGNGFILGTITRTHAFVASTGYSFEGPNNLITFSPGVTGVNSVTVVVKVESVSDFPFGGSIGRYYSVNIPSGSYTASLRLHYEDAELNGNDEAIMQNWRNPSSAWAVVGKNSNSASLNYVEKTGITNLNGRWTMTDDGSVLSWNGSVSSDWSVGANWSLVHGTFSGAPSGTDIVQIGVTPFTNQPEISTAATVKSIVFGSAQPVNLDLLAGGSLTANGSITGNWTGAATHNINVNAQTLTINGDLLLNDNLPNHIINLGIGAGTATITGNLYQADASSVSFSGAGTLSIGKNYSYVSGTFAPATGTVRYTGTVSQVVAPLSYYHLVIAKTASTIATLSAPSTVAGNFTLTSGVLDLNANLAVTGTFTISAGASMDANASVISVAGNWSKSATANFNAETSRVIFNGSGSQSISPGNFNLLDVNKAGGVATLTGNNTVNSNVSVLAGTLSLATFTLNKASAGDQFVLANGATLQLTGASNFPSGFSIYQLNPSSTVRYAGTVAQAVAEVTYGNIIFSNGAASAKTFSGAVLIQGDVTIASGATVNGGTAVITLNGNWSNTGDFDPATGDLILNGLNKTISGNTIFNDFTVNGSYTADGGNIGFNGHFQVTPTGSYHAGSGVATVNADFTNSGVVTSNGTTTFSGNVLQTIRLVNALQSTSTGIVNFNGSVSPVLNSNTTPTFYSLNINNTAGINPSVDWVILGDFTVAASASFNGGTSTHRFDRNVTNNGVITSSGILNFNTTTASTLSLAGTGFTSTGRVVLGGTAAVTISSFPAALNELVIANDNAAGVATPTGWTLTGKFSIKSDATFNAGNNSYSVGDNIESDGVLNGQSSTFTFTSATAELSASANSIFNHFVNSGTLTPQTDFRVAGNFTNNGVYDGSIGVLVMVGSAPAFIDGSTASSQIAQLTIEKSGGAVVTQNVNIINIQALNIFSGVLFTGVKTLTQDAGGGILIINDGATLRLGGTNSLPGFSGYSLHVNSNVDYAGTVQVVANAVDYGNLLFTAAGNKNALVSFVVRGNLLISAGNLTTTTVTLSHFVAGNFIMTGGTLAGTSSTYVLNGTADQTLTLTSSLVNLTVNKLSGQVNLGSAVVVNQLLQFSSGKINLGNYDLTIGNAGSIAGHNNTRYVIAVGTGALQQRVANGGNKFFPVGTIVNYTPAMLALTSASTSDIMGVRVIPAFYRDYYNLPARTNEAVDNSWIVSEAVAGGTDLTLSLEYPGSLELPGFIRSACRMLHHNGVIGEVGPADLAATGSNPYTVTRPNLVSLGVFGLSNTYVLPVSWLSVSAAQVNSDNKVEWTTSSEVNSSYFVVQASTNGSDFVDLGKLNSAAANTGSHDYQYLHKGAGGKAFFYRIRQVDIDGRFTYSRIVFVAASHSIVSAKLYPNPARSNVALQFIASDKGNAELRILNSAGQVMLKKPLSINTGSNQVVIQLSNYPTGIYQFEIIQEGTRIYGEKVIKQ